ncbi:collagen binding domain-containing protein [Paenibacillus sp. FSL W7-1279]|uniref:collagen binding domain-containing protein n=1 Tax=Paenibacillus sp. FSL W7-1279 TaxID=2921697 RepID=UPI0030DAA449
MKKKGSMLALIVILMVQGIFGTGLGMFNGQRVSAAGAGNPASDPGNGVSVTNAVYGSAAGQSILTNVTVQDSKGTVIDSVYNPDAGRVELGSDAILLYDWELGDNHNYVDGSTFEFDLPKAFKLYNSINGVLETDIGDVGTFTVSVDGHVVMTFNSLVDNAEVRGKLKFQTELSQEGIGGGTPDVEIPIELRDGVKQIIIPVKPAKGNLLGKNGKVVNDGRGKPSTILWTLQVNTVLERIDKPVIEDLIPSGLTLETGSVKINNLTVNVDGSTAVGAEAAVGEFSIDTSDASKLVVTKSSPMNSAYQIEYSTTIAAGDTTEFLNTATLSDNGQQKAYAENKQTIDRGELLAKEVVLYDENDRTIDWSILYNSRETTIPEVDARLEDRFNSTQELVNGSLQVKDTQTGAILTEGTDYVLTPLVNSGGKTGFDLKFEKDITTEHEITYQTKASGRVIKDETVTNSVYGNGVTREAKQLMQSKALIKSNDGFDYKDKTIKWQITLNQDTYSMDNVILKDMFTNGGLELTGPIVVKDAVGTLWDEGLDYTVDASTPNQGFTVEFLKPVDKAIIITYTTKFDYDLRQNKDDQSFWNRADLSWEEGSKPFSTTRNVSLKPNPLTVGNGDKSGAYDAVYKEITWTIQGNYNFNSVDKPVVKDKLVSPQQYVDGSLEVYNLNVDASGKTNRGVVIPSTQYSITEPSEANGNELQIAFKDKIDAPFLITFKTALGDRIIERESIANEAILMDDNTPVSNWNGSARVPRGGEYVAKTGVQNGEKIEWTLHINRGQSYVEAAKVSDEPSGNLILVEDSFRLYETKVAVDGTVTKTDKLVNHSDYKLNFIYGDTEKFVLEFLSPIDRPYILEYETLIDAADREVVSNSAGFEGKGITAGITDSKQRFEVRMSSGSGSGSGVRGSLEVLKVDRADPSLILEGATFVLQDTQGKRPEVTLTTDAAGKALFTKLLYGDYILKETSAPQGYVIDQATTTITIDSSIKQTGNVKRITITNSKDSVTPGPDPGNPDPNPGNPDPNPSNPDPNPGNPDPNPGNPDPNPGNPDPNPGNPDPNPGNPDPNPGNPDPNPGNPDPNPGNPDPNPGTSPGGTESPGGNNDKETPNVPGEIVRPGETDPVVPGEVDPEPIPVEVPEEDDTLVGNETANPQDPSTPSAENDTNRNPVQETKPESGPIAMLPKTGESNPEPFQLGGLALMLTGFILSRRLRNKRQ